MHILYKKILQIALLLAFVCLWGCGDSDESGEENDDAGQGTDSGNTEEDGGMDAGDVDDAGDSQDDAGPEYDPCWSVMDASLSEEISLYGVWGSGLEDVYAAGGIRENVDGGLRAAIMHFDGTSWSRMDIPDVPGFIHFIQGNSSGRVCTLSSGSYLMIFNGTEWDVVSTGLPGSDSRSDYMDFYYINAEDIYFSYLTSPTIALYHYNGEEFEEVINSNSLWGIWANASDDVYVGGGFDYMNTGILHYDGIDWSLIQIPDAGCAMDVWGTSSSNIYVTESGNSLSKWSIFNFDGLSWNIAFENISSNSRPRITGSSPDDVYVHGYITEGNGAEVEVKQTRIYHFDGNEWSEMNIPETWIFMNIWAASEGEAFAVGYDSEDEKARIFRYSCGR